ncbi:MAG TPA: hypothetical protein VMQ83_04830 [Gammaproteobacteria bacterium]|nr:hypothetical protein [Gammaproteobacteria bacterium]
MKRLGLLLIVFVVGCGGPSYRPVQEAPLDRVINNGSASDKSALGGLTQRLHGDGQIDIMCA